MSDIKFTCPNCSQHIACREIHRGRQMQCPACHAEITIPAAPVPPALPVPSASTIPFTRYGFFALWILVGLCFAIWYGKALTRSETHVYVLNGHDRPVTILDGDRKLATLRPDESRLLKLSDSAKLAVHPPEAAGTGSLQPKKGTWFLNLGSAYWVAATSLEYTSSFTTTTTQPKRFETPGLHEISSFVYAPFHVCEFTESPPGSVPAGFDHPQLKLACGSNAGRHALPTRGWLGPLTMNKEWGFTGALLPGGILGFIWLVGLLMLMPPTLASRLQPIAEAMRAN